MFTDARSFWLPANAKLFSFLLQTKAIVVTTNLLFLLSLHLIVDQWPVPVRAAAKCDDYELSNANYR